MADYISEQFCALWHHVEEQKWRKIKAILNDMRMGKSLRWSQTSLMWFRRGAWTRDK